MDFFIGAIAATGRTAESFDDETIGGLALAPAAPAAPAAAARHLRTTGMFMAVVWGWRGTGIFGRGNEGEKWKEQ